MTETYSVISDIHRVDTNLVSKAFQYSQDEKVDGVILNGDIVGESSGYNSVDYLAEIFDIAKKSKLETYVLSGSHEEFEIFEPLLNYFANKYKNIKNTRKNRKIEKEEFDLIFLPGSDWRSGNAIKNGYSLQTENKTGLYNNEEGGCIYNMNMHDLEELVTNPESTILFSHIPARFNGFETVDIAKFYEVKENFKIDNKIYRVGSVFPETVGYNFSIQGAPVEFKKENRGNRELRKIFEEIGITKNITGHFHESAGNANDFNNKKIKSKKYNSELFLNASYLDKRRLSIVSIDGEYISYKHEKI